MKKPVSDAKKKANRENSKKSTGPKSDEGKRKAKENAVKHGVYATRRVLRGEDDALYDAVKNEQMNRFSPKTYIDRALVDQLVADLWMLRRVARAELFVFKTIQEEREQEASHESPFSKFLQARSAGTSPSVEEEEEGAKAQKKASVGIGDIFENIFFIQEKQTAFERLNAFKRQILNNILSLEKELERRNES